SFLAEHPELAAGAAAPSAAVALLDQQSAALVGPRRAAEAPSAPSLAVPDGDFGVESPMTGAVLEVAVAAGATVAAGDTLMVVSAMKMETAVTAPCAGVVAELAPLEAGSSVAAGQVVAVIAPSHAGHAAPREHGAGTWAPLLGEVKALQDLAHARFAPG